MMSHPIRIAIIEDNLDLREELHFFLTEHGYSVWGVGSAEEFWRQLHLDAVDIVLVDIGLPGENGLSVVHLLRRLKAYGVIVITARGGVQERMRSMDLGADLYMVKPVNFAELKGAIDQLWHRIRAENINSYQLQANEQADWSLEARNLVSPAGHKLLLSPQEAVLVDMLLRHRNSVCSKERLHDHLFGYDSETDPHRVDVIVSRLRTKARKQGVELPIRALFGKGLAFLE